MRCASDDEQFRMLRGDFVSIAAGAHGTSPLARRAQTVVIAGATGDLGRRIGRSLTALDVKWRALVRSQTTETSRQSLRDLGGSVVEVDYGSLRSLMMSCVGADCIVSALNGLHPVVVDAQVTLLRAAVDAGVPRFIPSDYSLDYTKTAQGSNRNLDLRRHFSSHADLAPIRVTSILIGAFSELLAGSAPIIMPRIRRVLYWGDPDQAMDFTSRDDVARFIALAATDTHAPRHLRIAGDVKSPSQISDVMSDVTATPFRTLKLGNIARLDRLIRIAQLVSPAKDAVFPVWQGLQCQRDMATGAGKLLDLDNDRFGLLKWSSCRDAILAGRAR